MADEEVKMKITAVPQESSVDTTDDFYAKIGQTFRRVPISALVTLLKSSGFIKTDTDGIKQDKLATDPVIITPDLETPGAYVSSRTASQIYQSHIANFAIQPRYEYWLDANTAVVIRGTVLDVSETASVIAFLNYGATTPEVMIFKVEDYSVTARIVTLGGGDGTAEVTAAAVVAAITNMSQEQAAAVLTALGAEEAGASASAAATAASAAAAAAAASQAVAAVTDVIPSTASASNKLVDAETAAALAGEKILRMTQSGATYTYVGANFTFSSLSDLQALIQAGTMLWMVNTSTGSAYRAINSRGESTLARVTFAGPTLEADSDDPTVDVFLLDGSMNITKKTLRTGTVDFEDLSAEVQAMLEAAGQLIDVSQAVSDAQTAAAAAEAAAEAATTGANVLTIKNIINHGDLHKGDTTGWAKKSGAGTLSYDSTLQALKCDGACVVRIDTLNNAKPFNTAFVQGHRYYVALDAYSTTAASVNLNGAFGTTTKQTIPAETWTNVVFGEPIIATESSETVQGITIQTYANQIIYLKNIVVIDLDNILSGQTFPASDLRLLLAGQYVDTEAVTLQDFWESDAIRFPMEADMDTLLPLYGAYYTHAKARTAFPPLWRRTGQILRFRLNATQTIRMRYKSASVTDSAWANNENWEDLSNWPASHGMDSFTTSPTIKASGIDYTTEDFFVELVMEKFTPSGTGSFVLIDFLSRNVNGQTSYNVLRVNQNKLQYLGSGANYAFNFSNSVLKSGYNHILMVWKDGTCKTYVNGTLADTQTVAGSDFQYLEDITFTENCPSIALIRIGKNGDTVAGDRFQQCSPLTYDASNDQVVVEVRPGDFHAQGVVNRATGVFYPASITPLAASSYPDPIVGEGSPDVVPQFVGQRYYDSVNHLEYFSKGMTTSSNWARYTTNLELAQKQAILSSGVNIKTINNTSILGSGNIQIGEDGTGGSSGIVVNVVDHGAIGNGVADDTEAIMAAVEIVRQTGGTVYFPYNNGNCTYLIRQGLVLEKSMCVYADQGAVLKNASAVLADDAGNPGTGQCALTQITAAVAKGDHTVTVQSTVGLAVGQQITIFDTDITKPQYQDTHCIITDITGNTVTFDNARWTADGTDGGAVGSYAIGSYVMTNFSLIETPFRDSNDIVVENLTVQSCGNPQEPYCYTISPIHQTSQKKTAGSKQRRFTLINVTVDGSSQDGISVQGAGDINLINCTCKNVKWKGLHWGTSCDRVRVQGGLMDSCGTTAPSSDTVNLGNGGGGAMYFCIDNHDVIIDGVQVVNCRRGVFGYNNGSGGNGEVDTDSIITNCVFNNCERYGIEAGKGERLIVKGNLFRKFTGSAVPISLDKTETVTIEGNLFGEFADGYTNTLGAVKLSSVKQALVTGNNIELNANATGSFGIVLTGCQDSLAIGNIAAAVSVSDSGNTNVVKANNLELGVGT